MVCIMTPLVPCGKTVTVIRQENLQIFCSCQVPLTPGCEIKQSCLLCMNKEFFLYTDQLVNKIQFYIGKILF